MHRGQILFELDDKDFVSSAKALEAVGAAAVKNVEYRETALECNSGWGFAIWLRPRRRSNTAPWTWIPI